MNILLLVAFAILLWKSKLFAWGGTTEYLDRETTSSINGFFVILVFLRHFSQYIVLENGDYIYAIIDKFLGQGIVTTFLFYSGYGVMFSLIHKDGYSKRLLQRAISILLYFDAIVLTYIVILEVLGEHFNFKQISCALIAWDSVGNSNWYIFTIIILYTLSFLAECIAGKSYSTILVIMLIGTLTYIIILYNCSKDWRFFDTSLCYTLGMAYCLYKRKIEYILIQKGTYFTVLFVIIGCFFIIHICAYRVNITFVSIVLVETQFLLFVSIIVLLSLYIKIGNPVLSFLGRFIFEIYALQRLPMIVFQNRIDNKYIYFGVCLVITIAASLLLQRWRQAGK